jgi:hypothetical protein
VAARPDARHALALFEWSTMINPGVDVGRSVSLVGLIGEVVVGTTDPKRAGEVRIAVRGGSETFIAYCTEPFDSAFDGVGDCGTRQSTRRCHPVDVEVGASSDQEGNDARLPRSRARRGDAHIGR